MDRSHASHSEDLERGRDAHARAIGVPMLCGVDSTIMPRIVTR
jgi:hypothetical protein